MLNNIVLCLSDSLLCLLLVQATLESSWFLEEYQKVPGEFRGLGLHFASCNSETLSHKQAGDKLPVGANPWETKATLFTLAQPCSPGLPSQVGCSCLLTTWKWATNLLQTTLLHCFVP